MRCEATEGIVTGKAGGRGVSINADILVVSGRAFSPAESLEAIAGAGFKYIQIPNTPEWIALSSNVARLGLAIRQVHGSLSAAACSLDGEERKRAVDGEVERMRAAAVYAPCPYVIHYLPRYNDERRREAYRRSVEELLPVAAGLGFSLAVETVPYKPGTNERYAGSAEVAEFVRSFKSEGMRACIDLNHANIREDLVQVAENFKGIIACIHASDNHGEKEEHLLPGEGVIDFPRAFKAIREAGFSGPLNLEVEISATDKRATGELLTGIRRWLEKQDRLSRKSAVDQGKERT